MVAPVGEEVSPPNKTRKGCMMSTKNEAVETVEAVAGDAPKKRGRKPSGVPTRSTSVTINAAIFEAIEDIRWDHRRTFSQMVELMAEKFLESEGVKPVE